MVVVGVIAVEMVERKGGQEINEKPACKVVIDDKCMADHQLTILIIISSEKVEKYIKYKECIHDRIDNTS